MNWSSGEAYTEQRCSGPTEDDVPELHMRKRRGWGWGIAQGSASEFPQRWTAPEGLTCPRWPFTWVAAVECPLSKGSRLLL